MMQWRFKCSKLFKLGTTSSKFSRKGPALPQWLDPLARDQNSNEIKTI